MASVHWNGKSRLEKIHSSPVKALNPSARRLLGNMLDPPRHTFSRTCGIQQDWQGLAECMGLSYDEIQVIDGKDGKTYHLLEYWSQTPNSTVGRLLNYLEQMERFDVLEDQILQDRILNDVESYRLSQDRLKEATGLVQKPVQVPEVDSNVFPPNASYCDVPLQEEFTNITIGEVKTGQPEYFDAFVCYAAEDFPFVRQLINILEEQNGLKLCIKDRDITAGSANYAAISYLISQRCKKMIIVLSQNFTRCPECDFMVKFGQALCPGARVKKLIPIIIQQPCTVPDILRFITVVDYTKCGLAEWFWSRVHLSIKEMSAIDMNTAYGNHYTIKHNIQVEPQKPEERLDNQVTKAIRCTEMSVVMKAKATEVMDTMEESGIVESRSSSELTLPSIPSNSSTRQLVPQTEEKKQGFIRNMFKKKTHKESSESEHAGSS